MIALHRVDVADLNRRAHQRMDQSGRLWGPERHVDHLTVRAGDRIVCLRNDRRARVVNGTRGTIARIHRDGHIDILTDTADVFRLPARYVDDGHLTLGYAITGHKAQGLTVDHAHVLGSGALYREWGYVAMSRGRDTNQLYVTHAAQRCTTRAPRHAEQTLIDDLASSLGRAAADQPVAPVRARGRSH